MVCLSFVTCESSLDISKRRPEQKKQNRQQPKRHDILQEPDDDGAEADDGPEP